MYGNVTESNKFKIGDIVEILKGEFKGRTGRISQITHSRGKPKYLYIIYHIGKPNGYVSSEIKKI